MNGSSGSATSLAASCASSRAPLSSCTTIGPNRVHSTIAGGCASSAMLTRSAPQPCSSSRASATARSRVSGVSPGGGSAPPSGTRRYAPSSVAVSKRFSMTSTQLASPYFARSGDRHADVVVADAALLDRAVVVHERVGGAVVAVERHPDAAGVDELDAAVARGLARERDVRVPEDEPQLDDVLQQLGLVVGGLGRERLDVGCR